MTTFNLEKRLPSCAVSKRLIEELETYVKIELAKTLLLDPQKVSNSYQLSITDNFGTETLPSIAVYPLQLFSDTTQVIELGLGIYSPFSFRLHMTFRQEDYLSKVSLALESDNARERVLTIYQTLDRFVRAHSNRNWLFHPPASAWGFLSGILFLFWPAAFALLTRDTSWGIAAILIAALVTAYLFVAPKLKPYTSFESNAQIATQKFADWLVYGFLTFAVFGTLFVLLRRFLLGF